MLSRSIPKWAQKICTIRKTFIKTFAIARRKSNMWAIYGKKLVMPLEAKLATKSFQFHVHPHYKAKSKNVNCLCSYLQVPQITKSLESFDILPQQYRTKEVSKTLIMQLSFFGVQNRLRHVLRYKCINLCNLWNVISQNESLESNISDGPFSAFPTQKSFFELACGSGVADRLA